MRGMKTARAIGGIDESFIEEAMPEEIITVKVFPWKFAAMAAAVAVVVCLGVVLMIHNANSFDEQITDTTSSEASGQWEKKHVSKDSSSQTDTAKEKSEADMSICERYGSFSIYDTEYTACMAKIDPEKTKYKNTTNVLTKMTEDGYIMPGDVEAEIFEIEGVNYELAVAVRFHKYYDPEKPPTDPKELYLDSNGDLYVYMNTEYKTGSLYALAYACSLKDNVTFGSAYRYDGDKTIEFTGIDKQRVFDILFAEAQQCAQIKNPDEFMTKNGFKPYISISTTVDVLGRNNFSISLSEDGYLFTNIFKTARLYNVGKERVQRFKEYLEAQCKGYELVYDIDPDDSSQAYTAE